MASDNVRSGFWSEGQEALAVELSNSDAANMPTTTGPSQTPWAKRKANIYERVISGERRPRGGSTQ